MTISRWEVPPDTVVTPDNGGALVSAGADFLAVSGAVWNAEDPAAVVAAFQPLLKR